MNVPHQLAWAITALDIDNQASLNTLIRELHANQAYFDQKLYNQWNNPNHHDYLEDLHITPVERQQDPVKSQQYNVALASYLTTKKMRKLNHDILTLILQTGYEVDNLERHLGIRR